jgi:hypothetical protein
VTARADQGVLNKDVTLWSVSASAVSGQEECPMVSDCESCFAFSECLNGENRVAVNDHENCLNYHALHHILKGGPPRISGISGSR